jgi:hypothetical protein
MRLFGGTLSLSREIQCWEAKQNERFFGCTPDKLDTLFIGHSVHVKHQNAIRKMVYANFYVDLRGRSLSEAMWKGGGNFLSRPPVVLKVKAVVDVMSPHECV